VLLLPAFFFVSAAGCGKKEETKTGKGGTQGQIPVTPAELTELDSTGWGTLTGIVVYDGTPPEAKKIDMKGNKDEKACHADAKEYQLVEQTWLVNPKNKGVANVVIWLKPPENTFFKIHESYLKMKDSVVTLSQPRCVFEPHIVVHWAAYYDKESKEEKRSPQKFRILNNAEFLHNTAWTPGTEGINVGASLTLKPGAEVFKEFNPDLAKPLSFKCDIHQWMNAKAWVVDHPYVTTTDMDGNFKIENVPTGVELHVAVWHEGVGFLKEYGGAAGKKMKLEKDTKLEIKISK
jgi:hypothetical protein